MGVNTTSMFSLENFYFILYYNLLKPINALGHYFMPFGSVDPTDLITTENGFDVPTDAFHYVGSWGAHSFYFYDQEPLTDITIPTQFVYMTNHSFKYSNVFVNSEKSQIKRDICKEYNFIDLYYFFHGFAALSWYSDYKYVGNVDYKFDKAFISLNRLTTKDRSYRLYVVSKMLEKDIVQYGRVSLNLTDPNQPHWKEELLDSHCKLSKHAKVTIYKNLKDVHGSLIADVENPMGDCSAHAGHNELKLNQSALWHVVTETVFYHDKLHLTEKVFKPIVSHRPFLLVAAPGNLAYLKSYGFKTFDRWVDESYDNETDNDKRMDMVVDELEKIAKLSPSELKAMHAEMKEVLDYNFNHFYGKFREIITDELLDNFKSVATQWNNGRFNGKTIDLNLIDFPQVRSLLLN